MSGKKAVLTALIGFVFIGFSAGQGPICGNDILDSLLMATDPNYSTRLDSMEQIIYQMDLNRTTTEPNLDRVIPAARCFS